MRPMPVHVRLISSRCASSFSAIVLVIFWVADVDVMHARARAHGYEPEMAPADAPWGERYFHVLDPDGHELSFARLL